MNKRRISAVVVVMVAVAATGILLFRTQGSPSLASDASADGTGSETRDGKLWRSRSAPHNPTPASAADAGADDELGELVPKREACDDFCGSRCLTDAQGRLRCPKLCSSDQDCGGDTPLCEATRIAASGHRYWRCIPSECSGPTPAGHRECGPHRTCGYIGRHEGGVYQCEDAGDRQAGEPCGHQDYARAGLCAVGRRCVSGLCLPARCESNADCPKGSVCGQPAGGTTDKHCSLACTNDADCPTEQRCIELPWGTRRCTKQDKPSCLQQGCPTGSYCHVHFDAPYQVVARCERSCSLDATVDSCGKDAFCAENDGLNDLAVKARCYQRCTSDAACPEGFRCVRYENERYCSFALGTAMDRHFSAAYPDK